MTPGIPRVLLMCLALAFASLWLGCGPQEDDETDALSQDLAGSDGPACACAESDCE